MTLEELMVVSAPQCSISNETNRVVIEFTPTVPHCGMSTVIGVLYSSNTCETYLSPQASHYGSVC